MTPEIIDDAARALLRSTTAAQVLAYEIIDGTMTDKIAVDALRDLKAEIDARLGLLIRIAS